VNIFFPIIVAIACAGAALYFFMAKKRAESGLQDAVQGAARAAEEKLGKELAAAREELAKKKAESVELRERLSDHKAKSFKQREADRKQKGGAETELADQLSSARRQLDEGRAQFDALTREAAGMQTEIARLRDGSKKLEDSLRAAQNAAARAAAPAPEKPAEPAPAAAAAVPAEPAKPSAEDELRARVAQLETQVREARRKASEHEDEAKKARGKSSTVNRLHALARSELDLFKEKLVWSEKRVVELEKLLFDNRIALPERETAPQPRAPQLAPGLQARESVNTGGEGVVAEVADYEPPAESEAAAASDAPAAEQASTDNGPAPVPPVRRRRAENGTSDAPAAEGGDAPQP